MIVIQFDFFFLLFNFFVWITKWATEFKIMMNSIMLLHCKSCVDINVDINFSPEIMSGSVDFYFLVWNQSIRQFTHNSLYFLFIWCYKFPWCILSTDWLEVFFFPILFKKKISPNKCWQILLGTKIRFNVYIYIYICICVFSCLAKPSCRSYHLCDAISILACFVGNFIVDTPVIRIFHWIFSIKRFRSTLLKGAFCTN